MNSTLRATTLEHEPRDTQWRVGFIGTMPRSGTWYASLFFDAYRQLLKGTTVEVNICRTLIRAGVDLGVDYLAIMHAICPGFFRHQVQKHAAWEELEFYHAGYDLLSVFGRNSEMLQPHERWIENYEALIDPGINPNARIVYVYRNPLDQVISAFQHSLNCDSDDLRVYLKRFSGPRDFFFYAGLDTYTKQYFSYKYMKEAYPDHVMFVTYEQLMRDAKHVFSRILDFFGHDLANPRRENIISASLHLASRESVKKIEKQAGMSLAGDQVGSQASHIKDGAIGKWKKYFDQQDLRQLAAYWDRFGISMDEFTFE